MQAVKRAYSPAAFSVGTFDSELALDRSLSVQRERRWCGDFIDLRDDVRGEALAVSLIEGPYHRKLAVVNPGQRQAWVVGDHSYAMTDGRWVWSYDAFC